MNGAINAGLAIIGAIITLAIVATLVGKNAQTPAVLKAGGDTLATVIGAAVNPVSTAATNGNLGANTFTAPSIGGILGGLAGGVGGLFGG